MRLIKYRSHALDPCVWFWIDDDDITVSPLFNSKEDANKWYGQQIRESQNDS